MAENSFLNGMKIDQFLKSNNDQMKQNISDAFSGIAKDVSDVLRLEKLSAKNISSITKSVSSIPIMNNTITKMYDLQKKTADMHTQGGKDLSKTLDTIMSKQDNRITTLVSKLNKRDNTSKKDNSITKLVSKSNKRDTASKKVSTKKDFFKRENPNDDRDELLEDINTGISSLVGLEQKKKNGKSKGLMGLFGGLGGVLAVGGLAAYLITGKKEFLFTVAKGIRHTIKAVIAPFKIMASLSKTIMAPFMKLLGFTDKAKDAAKAADVAAKAAKAAKAANDATKATKALKNAKNVTKVVKGVDKANDVAKTAKGVGGLFKFLKTGAKVGVKGGAKAGLKRIPILGSVMGIGFGISRMMKGDITGGLMEFGSAGLGALDMVAPGVGTALSLGMDVAIGARDITRAKADADGSVGNVGGGGLTMSEADIVMGNNKHLSKYLVNNKSTSKGKRKGRGTRRGVRKSYKKAGKDDNFIKGGTSGYEASVKQLSKNKRLSKMMKLNGAKGYQPNIIGLNPKFRRHIEDLAADYHNESHGGYLMINSAKRSGGGGSVHNVGQAIDMNTIDANGKYGYVSDELLAKNGLHMPLLKYHSIYGKKEDEPWHVESFPGEEAYGGERNRLAGNDQPYRKGVLLRGGEASFAKAPTGGGGFNLPQGNITKTVNDASPSQVILSDGDINKLAMAFGKQIRDNTPKQKTHTIPVGAGNVRSSI